MKAKYIILLAICAVVTLSFTFGAKNVKQNKTSREAALGGIASEDPIK